ncbi:MAG: Uma2 family endonuclease [Anaerolineae bacterium]
MSSQSVQIIDRPRTTPARSQPVQPKEPPPLNTGDHLTRAEFERRYLAHPEIKKAELVEGVVYAPTPVRYQQHGNPHFDVITWLGVYRAVTPGVLGGDNATLLLDLENEPQPDALLRLEPEVGGRSHVTEDDYLEGTPELIVEVAASSAAYDLHVKRRVYARSGVQEYLAVQVYEQRIDWFVLREGVYEPLAPDENGVLRSEVFPGLWLQPAAFWAGDLAAMLAVLQEGLASPDHAAFVARLQARQSATPPTSE